MSAMLAEGDNRPRDWSALPVELLACIRGCLPPRGFVRFAAVCGAWRLATPSMPAAQLPWLMVPRFSSSSFSPSAPGDGATCLFFDGSEGKVHRVAMPELVETRSVGCWQGWVASVDWATAEVSLVNPLTGARVGLPSLTTMPEFEAKYDSQGRLKYVFHPEKRNSLATICLAEDADGLIRKVVMSSKPTATPCKLTASFACALPLAFTAVGADRWRVLKGAKHMEDITYHDGEGMFYGVDYDGKLFRWVLDHEGNNTLEHCRAEPNFYREASNDYVLSSRKRLAVHRPSGDLLLLFIDHYLLWSICGAAEDTAWMVEAVKVFGYSGDGAVGTWRPLNTLGGCALFLGEKNQSICISPQDVPQLRSDCIFFIEQTYGGGAEGRTETQKLWVYNLKKGVLEPHFPPDKWKRYGLPLWFTPSVS